MHNIAPNQFQTARQLFAACFTVCWDCWIQCSNDALGECHTVWRWVINGGVGIVIGIKLLKRKEEINEKRGLSRSGNVRQGVKNMRRDYEWPREEKVRRTFSDVASLVFIASPHHDKAWINKSDLCDKWMWLCTTALFIRFSWTGVIN